ncbi:MAG: hypothetical protein R3C32_03430 [Chloroflexota bacterium]
MLGDRRAALAVHVEHDRPIDEGHDEVWQPGRDDHGPSLATTPAAPPADLGERDLERLAQFGELVLVEMLEDLGAVPDRRDVTCSTATARRDPELHQPGRHLDHEPRRLTVGPLVGHHPGGADRRVTRERQLGARREDPQPD